MRTPSFVLAAAVLALAFTAPVAGRFASPWVSDAEAAGSVRFDGVNDYVTFGAAPSLGATTFTLEVWFKREGTGQLASSGTGGVAAIPLLAKGRGEADGDTRDENYFLGIRSDGRLVADYEEGTGQTSPGLNHPIAGTTTIQLNTWYHAAATFDGTRFRLLLNGVVENDTLLAANRRPQSASVQHASLASALTSTGAAAGYFKGTLDEARVWNVARAPQAILDSMSLAIANAPGLIGRWALDEGSGASASSTVAGAPAGTLVNGPMWVADTPIGAAANAPPAAPVLVAPANGAQASTSPSLDVRVSDPEGAALTVTWFGRPVGGVAGPDFTLIGLPDTQYYTSAMNGGTPEIFKTQTRWIVEQKAARNIVDVVQLGDCTQNGDNGGNPVQWLRADSAMKTIEDPLTTALPSGLPFGVCVGNHDQSPAGDASGTTNFFNQYFGAARFAGRAYYRGHFGGNNDNHVHTFSASGLDFIVVCLEYDTTPDAAVLNWADSVLAANPTRRAIVASHYIIDAGNPATFGTQGRAIYDALKDRPNLFLMLSGHVTPEEGRRSDVFEGRTVHSVMSDYQSRAHGGDGWLRLYEFSPANGVIRVRTYSPTLGRFETDADSSSQFTLPYDMGASSAFQALGASTGAASGAVASRVWPGLIAGRDYEWYVTVSDGVQTVTGPVWRVTATGAPPPPPGELVGNPGFETNLTGWIAYGNASVSRVAGGHSGGYAMQIASSSSSTFGCDDSPNWVGVVAGQGAVYRLSAWVRAATSRSKVRIRVYELLNGVQQGSTVYSPDVTLSSSWQLVTVNHTVRVAGSVISMRVTETPTTSSRTFLVDDVSIQLVSGPTSVVALAGEAQVESAAAESPRFSATLAPNPVHGSATVALVTTRQGRARVVVFDAAGRRVATPLDVASLPPGRHALTLGDALRGAPAGLYFYRVETPEGVVRARFAIVR